MGVRRFLLVCAVGLVVACGLGWLLLMGDDNEGLPTSADAVVVVEGSEETLPRGQALVRRGVARTLVVSTSEGSHDTQRRTLCRAPKDNVVCVISGPFSTGGGELQLLARVARDRDWDSVVVVAPSYLNVRLDRVFDRCADARVAHVEVDEPWWRDAIALPLEWVNLAVSETVRRNC